MPPSSRDLLMRKALASAGVQRRYLALVCERALSSGCRPWLGAIGGRGHGRFWIACDADGRDLVTSAHRVGYAIHYGIDTLDTTKVVRHECDEPICQTPEHWSLGSVQQNTAEFMIRRMVVGNPLRDVRGAAGRSRSIRAAARAGEDLDAAATAGLPFNDLHQDPLF